MLLRNSIKQRSLQYLVLLVGIVTIIRGDDTLTNSDTQSSCVLDAAAQSAVNRARTESCKTYLRNIACEVATNPNFIPQTLPRYCPINSGNYGELIGCALKESLNTSRFLPYQFNTSIECVDYCLKYASAYAAYNEFNSECSCWIKYNNESEENILVMNQTCSDWLSETEDHTKDEFVTLYRTSYAPAGDRLDRNVAPREISLVFLLMVSGQKNVRQLKRLMRAIYSSEHYYIIHVDSNENYLYHQLISLTDRYSNIILAKKRYRTTWASNILLSAVVDVFKQVVEELKWDFAFLVTITESDFPIKPVKDLARFLSMFPTHSFVAAEPANANKMMLSNDATSVFVSCDGYLYRVGKKRFPRNIVFEFGSEWAILNHQFVEYIVHGDDELIRGLKVMFNHSAMPCESFYHTLLINSIFCDTYVRDHLRLFNWNTDRGCTCFNSDAGDLCGCSPLAYRIVDKKLFAESAGNPVFFARKFDPTIDERIIDWIDESVFGINTTKGALYLQNMYHSEYNTATLSEFNEFLAIMESHARSILIQHERYRLLQALNFKQIHSVFNLGVFQGYTFQYVTEDEDKLEIFLKQSSETKILSQFIDAFDIGFIVDTREDIFIDRSRTFIEPLIVTIIVECNSEIDDELLLMMEDPTGKIIERVFIEWINETAMMDIAFPKITSQSMIGIWNMHVVSTATSNTLASLNFLILPFNQTKARDYVWKIDTPTLNQFWPVEDICSIDNHGTTCTESCQVDDCGSKKWSVFYNDIKSNI